MIQIRNSQIIHTYGVGAIADFPELSLMMLAPDVGSNDWGAPADRRHIEDARLAAAFFVESFVQPPVFPNGQGTAVQSVRFPSSLICPNCNIIRNVSDIEASPVVTGPSDPDRQMQAHICPDCFHRYRQLQVRMYPARFIIANEYGYIDDFPWDWYCHRSVPDERNKGHRIFLKSRGMTAAISGLYLTSVDSRGNTVVAMQPLAEIFNPDIFSDPDDDYFGSKNPATGAPLMAVPWKGKEWRNNRYHLKRESLRLPGNRRNAEGSLNRTAKSLYPRTLQRGAGNVYFPLAFKGISLPPDAPLTARRLPEEVEFYLNEKLKNDFDLQEAADNQAKLNIMLGWLVDSRKCNHVINRFSGRYSRAELEQFFRIKFPSDTPGTAANENQYAKKQALRREEYECFLTPRTPDDFWYQTTIIPGARYQGWEALLDKVVMLDKLRELKILKGFTRIRPLSVDDLIFANHESDVAPLLQEEYRRIQDVRADPPNFPFLPAVEMKGEGILLTFSHRLLSEWETREGVQTRMRQLNENYFQSLRKQAVIFDTGEDVSLRTSISARYVMLHTLSHLLIQVLSEDCGYSASSLAEIIYCSDEKDREPMNGILIYTSSSDTDGTLGGLVEKGQPGNLSRILSLVMEKAEWCSSDPLCIESAQGQGFMAVNLGACHSCALLPETSCENMNKFLDRALLVGTLDQPEAGLFSFIGQ